MKVSIILPTFNEEASIENTITEISVKLSRFCSAIEILVVDDGSTDLTFPIVKKLQERDKRIVILRHLINKGYGAAFKTGVKNASFDWIFFTDADLQFNVDELENFISKREEYDFIVGYRQNRADQLRRKIVSYFYNRIIRFLFGLRLRDVDCAFKLIKRTAVRSIDLRSESFFISVELMVKAFKMNYKITEIGVEHFPRAKGFSKVTTRQIFLTIFDLFRLYTSLV